MADLHELLTAIKQGEKDRVLTLLSNRPDLVGRTGEKGLTPLMVALYHHQRPIADLIRSHREGLTLHEAAAYGEAESVALWLQREEEAIESWSADGFQPLHLAAYFGHPNTTALLIEEDAPLEEPAQNPSAVRPLHAAVASTRPEVVQLLLSAGANPDAPQQGGWTALHAAARNGLTEVVKLLLVHDADPGLAADNGQTARELAGEQNHGDILELLDSPSA